MKNKRTLISILLVLILSIIVFIPLTMVEKLKLINIEANIYIEYQEKPTSAEMKSIHVSYICSNINVTCREFPPFMPYIRGHLTFLKVKISVYDGEMLLLEFEEEVIQSGSRVFGKVCYKNITQIDMDFNQTIRAVLEFQVEGYIAAFEIWKISSYTAVGSVEEEAPKNI